jgi:hypothetical protein
MWIAEHVIETTVSPEAIWRQWADVAGWPEWNGDLERAQLEGPFAAGSRITMTPFGQDAIELRIAETAERTLFVDEADLGKPAALPGGPPLIGATGGRYPAARDSRSGVAARRGAMSYSGSLRLAEPSIVSGPRPDAEIWIRRGFACSATGSSSVSTPWS